MIDYKDLKLEVNKDVTEFEFNGKEIKVLKYLPVKDKYDLVMTALEKASDNGIVNELKLDIYFHLNIIYLYTNIEFTQDDRDNELMLFDELKSSGFLDACLEVLDEFEYQDLMYAVEKTREDSLYYNTTAVSLLRTFIEDLPKSVEAAAAAVDSFDQEKYKSIINLAEATGQKK